MRVTVLVGKEEAQVSFSITALSCSNIIFLLFDNNAHSVPSIMRRCWQGEGSVEMSLTLSASNSTLSYHHANGFLNSEMKQ